MHGNAYYFWSGVGNDIPIYIFGILPVIIAWYRHNKCHYPRCYRFGHHPWKHYKLCKKHHPEVGSRLTHLDIISAHRKENSH